MADTVRLNSLYSLKGDSGVIWLINYLRIGIPRTGRNAPILSLGRRAILVWPTGKAPGRGGVDTAQLVHEYLA